MQTTEGLTERCRHYIDGIRSHYKSEPLPAGSRRHADRLRQVAPGVHAGISPFIGFCLSTGPAGARRVPEVVTVADGNGVTLAYNSTWQTRNNAWCSLEETSAQLALAGAQHRPVAGLGKEIARLLDVLGPIERFWAFPGIQAFQKVGGCSRGQVRPVRGAGLRHQPRAGHRLVPHRPGLGPGRRGRLSGPDGPPDGAGEP